MQINGIIAEYNPFHNGHKYQLEAARDKRGADYTIVVMSGNFVQRGTPAILDKYIRTEMALSNGADLVLELPAIYATGSAEYFATGAVALLDRLGVVDSLCFGSECGQIQALSKLASILLEEPDAYKARLRIKLRQGYSFPHARSMALIEYCPELRDTLELFNSPNNILGIEYIKALLRRGSSIQPYTTLRVGSDYHDKRLGSNQASALAIRQSVFSRQDLNCLKGQMPENAFNMMYRHWEKWFPIHSNDFSLLLHYKLLSLQETGYDKFADVSPDLSDRIRRNLFEFTNVKGFCDLLKSRELTYTRISRCMMHILLDITNEELEQYRELDYVPYARVLGFRKDSTPLLGAIKKNSSIPLITKLADADKALEVSSLGMLRKDLAVSHIYNSVAASKARMKMQNEYTRQLVII